MELMVADRLFESYLKDKKHYIEIFLNETHNNRGHTGFHTLPLIFIISQFV